MTDIRIRVFPFRRLRDNGKRFTDYLYFSFFEDNGYERDRRRRAFSPRPSPRES